VYRHKPGRCREEGTDPTLFFDVGIVAAWTFSLHIKGTVRSRLLDLFGADLTLCLSTLPPTPRVPRPRIAGSGLFGLDCLGGDFKIIVIDHSRVIFPLRKNRIRKGERHFGFVGFDLRSIIRSNDLEHTSVNTALVHHHHQPTHSSLYLLPLTLEEASTSLTHPVLRAPH